MAVIYLCPADKRLLCSWEGDATEIKQHFQNEHNGLLFHTNSVEIDLHKLPENKLLDLEKELYLMQTYIEEKKIIVRLRYLGTNEAASKLQYDVTITVNNVSYRYDPSRYFSCVVPTLQGWEVNLECLEKFHGSLNSVNCTILLEKALVVERKISNTSLKINNSYVENHACDETEDDMIQDLIYLDEKIAHLKEQKVENSKELDKIELKQQEQVKVANSKELDKIELKQQEQVKVANSKELDKIELKQQEEVKARGIENADLLDRDSVIDFSILEEPFSEGYKKFVKEYSTELPKIPEELNLACSSCHLGLLPPIYLCTNGHNVCTWCKSSPCKICNSVITIIRNTDLENVSRTHLHQCRYASEGCYERHLYNNIRAHEAKCNFCRYKCMSECPYEGKFDSFTNHLKIVHSSVKIGLTTRNDFPKNTEFYVVNKSVGIFYCHSEVSEDFIIWRATFCGPSERQFFCEISFRGSKYKEPVFLKRKGNMYEIRKPLSELKKNKAKEKYATLIITSYDG